MTREYRSYYRCGTKPELAEFGEACYLLLEGRGEPAGEVFTGAVEALYPLAYGIKKVCREQGKDFGVPKLEGLWWVEGDTPALEVSRSEWCWKLLIRMPLYVTEEMMTDVQPVVAARKKNDLIIDVSFAKFTEGRCAQIMHIGPYSTEPETIAILMEFITDSGLAVSGLHHEVYLSDPRKTEPSRMKTIIRYPVR